jgi:hypothetical protein
MNDLAHIVANRGLRHVLFSFTDLFGVQRAKLVPASAVAALAEGGAGFAGFAAWLQLTPADPDVLALPDPASLMVLPWQRDVAWVATDLVVEGTPLEQAPRRVLQQQLKRAEALGFEFCSGVEAEFFLLDPEQGGVADRFDRQSKPCYDQLSLMRRYPLISELIGSMEELGWGPYQADHEDANGQFELNWTFADALTTADRHAFFKVMAATLAEKHGCGVSFDPKPIEGLTGNGAHLHVSLWQGGRNLFHEPAGEKGLSTPGLSLPRRPARPCPCPLRPHQSIAGQLSPPGPGQHQLWLHLVTGLDQLRRQQPHPPGAHPRRSAPRTAPARWRRQPLPAAGGGAGGRPRWHRAPARSRPPQRCQHLHRPPGTGYGPAPARQPGGSPGGLRG